MKIQPLTEKYKDDQKIGLIQTFLKRGNCAVKFS